MDGQKEELRMALVNEKTVQMDGYQLHLIQTEKYKTNTLVWKMKAPLQQETATLRALLPHVLQSSTGTYPSTTALRSYLDELYGASLYVDLGKKGEYHIITFTLEIANEKFLKDPTPLLEKGIGLFADVLMNPHAENGAFHAASVEKEKRILIQRIQSVYDDKMRYSSMRLIEEMCKGEPYALPANGEENMVRDITPDSLYSYYEQAFSEDEMDFYIIGDVDPAEAEALCRSISFSAREPKTVRLEAAHAGEAKEIKEVEDISQGKLNIGYRTHITYGDSDYFALQMFNGLFGGFTHSKLFLNVREKASLAYYVASRVESHKGLMMVMSGIEGENYSKAVKIIHEQMEAMKAGDFSEEEMEQTKAVIKNQFLESIDMPRGIVEILYHNVVAESDVPLEAWIDSLGHITKKDIVRVANKIELDTIYFLTGKEGQQ